MLAPGADRAPVHADDAVAGAKPGLLRQRILAHPSHQRLDVIAAGHQHEPDGKNRKQEIIRRSRDHDGAAHAERLAVERTLHFGRVDLAFGLVEHLDIAAEGNQANAIFGGVVLASPGEQWATKADGKLQHLDAEFARHLEVAVFVHRHQNGDGGDKSE